MHAEPTTSSAIVQEIAEGTEFNVTDGPQCADGYTWWKLQFADGSSGWSAEGNDQSYFLEPYLTISTSSNPTSDIVGFWEQYPPEFRYAGNEAGSHYAFYPGGAVMFFPPL